MAGALQCKSPPLRGGRTPNPAGGSEQAPCGLSPGTPTKLRSPGQGQGAQDPQREWQLPLTEHPLVCAQALYPVLLGAGVCVLPTDEETEARREKFQIQRHSSAERWSRT